jgi:hypothetical protein
MKTLPEKIDHLFSKINWSASFLDAEAVQIMNKLKSDVIELQNNSLESAKQHLRDNYKQGTECPCCHQHVKEYKRKLNSSMAYGLIILFKAHQRIGFNKYVKMNEEVAKLKIPSSNIEYSKLAYWGLIEEKPNTNPKIKNSGFWMITTDGQDFVQNKMMMRKYARIYNKLCNGFDGPLINIKDALSSKFNYEELMNQL